MNEQTKPLHHFTLAEITKLAEKHGLEVEGKDRQQLIREVKDTTTVGDEAPAPEINQHVEGQVDVAPDGFSGERLKVNFPRQEGPGGNDPITLTLNGFRCDIEREHDVNVLVELLDMVDTLTITDYREVDGKTIPYERKRFPYQVIR
jgi:hypothetical protein